VTILLAVLGLLSVAHQAGMLGLLWIALRRSLLRQCRYCTSMAPLVHSRPPGSIFSWAAPALRSRCSVLFCLGYASLHGGGGGDLTFTRLISPGAGLSRPWVLTAWVLLLVAYGTKMGLAPMHTWKPDAYGEAPSIVGALLAGGVTTVAFTAILRVRLRGKWRR